jgi:quercetin dioxygenase-like cupin family protein
MRRMGWLDTTHAIIRTMLFPGGTTQKKIFRIRRVKEIQAYSASSNASANLRSAREDNERAWRLVMASGFRDAAGGFNIRRVRQGGQKMTRSPAQPQAIRTHAGGIRLLITSEETGGAMSMIETDVAPGGGPTYHRHSREDETFYVVSGTAEVQIENEIFLCKAGDRVYGPRNVFHTYRNVGDTDLKMIIVYTPAGFERSFVDAATMLQQGKDQSEIGRMLLQRYGLTRGQLPAS